MCLSLWATRSSPIIIDNLSSHGCLCELSFEVNFQVKNLWNVCQSFWLFFIHLTLKTNCVLNFRLGIGNVKLTESLATESLHFTGSIISSHGNFFVIKNWRAKRMSKKDDSGFLCGRCQRRPLRRNLNGDPAVHWFEGWRLEEETAGAKALRWRGSRTNQKYLCG